MSNYPPGSSYPYGGGAAGYGGPPPYAAGYGGPPPAQPYPAAGGYGPPPPSYDGYGGTAPPSAPYTAAPGGEKPSKAQQGGYGYGYDASAPYAAAPGGEKPFKAQQGGYGYGYDASAAPGGEKPSKAQQGRYGYGYEASAPYAAAPGGEKPSKAQQGGYGYGSAPYDAAPGGEKPPKAQQGGYGYGYEASAPYVAGPPGGEKPPKTQQGGYGYGYEGSAPPAPYGSYGGSGVFSSLVPSSPASAFPPGTDPNVVACFQAADQHGSGFIDDKELQRALSSYNESFSLRTVRLMMHLFTSSNERKIGPKDFTSVFYSLQNWRAIFERFDRDRSGKIDTTELRDALLSLGLAVSPMVLNLLVSKFDRTGGRNNAIEYDHFIECCLTVKGLTEKFKEKDVGFRGSATFSYESFMLTVLPFLIA